MVSTLKNIKFGRGEGNIKTVWKNISCKKGIRTQSSLPFNTKAVGKNISSWELYILLNFRKRPRFAGQYLSKFGVKVSIYLEKVRYDGLQVAC